MKKVVFSCSLVLLVLFVVNTIPAIAKQPVVAIGGAQIVLPEIKGYSEEAFENPELQHFFQTVSPGLKVVWAYLNDEDASLVTDGHGPRLGTYIMVQCLEEVQENTYSVSAFQGVKAEVREGIVADGREMESTLNEVQSRVKDEYDFDINLDGSTNMIGIFQNTDFVFGFASMSRIRSELDGDFSEKVLVSTTSLVLAGGKLLYVSVGKTYTDQSDLAYVQNISTQYCDALVQLNPSVKDDVSQASAEVLGIFSGIVGINLGLVVLACLLWGGYKLIVRSRKK